MGMVLYHLSPVTRFAVNLILIKPTVQVQAFENKLNGRCDAGGTAPAIEFVNSLAESAYLGELVDVLHRREIIAYLHVQSTLETRHQLFKFAHFKVVTEDFQDSAVHEFLHHTLFLDIAYGIKLDLATGRGDDSGKVAHARSNLALFQAQGAAARIAEDVLKVRDRDTHTHP